MKQEMSAYLEAYSAEAEEHMQNLNAALLRLEKDPADTEAINSVFRSAHTLKSSSAAMGFEKISELAHSMEDVLGRLRNKEIEPDRQIMTALFTCVDMLQSLIDHAVSGKGGETDTAKMMIALKKIMQRKTKGQTSAAVGKKEDTSTQQGPQLEGADLAANPQELRTVSFIKVGVDRLDKLMDLVGELLITKMRIKQIAKEMPSAGEPVDSLDKLISELSHEVMAARLIPVGQVFNRFPRMVRDIADKEGKKVEFIMRGEEIELDRSVLDKLGEPLVHLLRNAVDHGVETPQERKAQGKPEIARLTLTASKERGSAVIRVEDDGAGFDIEVIKATAERKRIATKEELDRMPNGKILELPFHPDFSTSKQVTEFSGRGVGLNVVKTNVESMKGTVSVKSERGKGTAFILELPLSLAFIKCFLVRAEKETYGIPLSNVIRNVRILTKDIKTIEGGESFILDNEDIPLIRLRRLLNIPEEQATMLTVVIVERGDEKAGIAVDRIIGEQDLIIKALDETLKEAKGFSGATILGDGKVALILDMNTLI